MNTTKNGTLLVIEESKFDSVLYTLQMAMSEKDDRDFLIEEAMNQLNDIKNRAF